MIMSKNYNPVIFFAFCKQEREALAVQMSKLEFNSAEEQDIITNIFTNAIDDLALDDRQLPQIPNILPLLKHEIGIDIHHGKGYYLPEQESNDLTPICITVTHSRYTPGTEDISTQV